ncbi:50S ribosomal protein-like protein L2 [Lophium mytilinum]|uniref:Large ribosomal subunit protein uL2m n=1 Tax=Lophium mytilinum TaxID=390894 RepID=A0A6A6QYK0_9PEZI|nr:50S ribosomal protein-like protein L2 [Lophium mytilinum]
MLQTRLPLRPTSTACRCLLSTIRSYAVAAVDRKPPPTLEPTVSAGDGQIYQAAGPRKESTVQMRTYKPRTPGLRHLKRPINDHLWKGRPVSKLTYPKTGMGKAGRNNSGHVTVRHRGGGHKRRIRIIDYHRRGPGEHVVERIEYDPNRSSHIALLSNSKTKEQSYVVAADGMRAGDKVESFRSGIPQHLIASMGGVIDPGMLAAKTAFRGNCLPVRMVPIGTQIFNVGSKATGGAVFCRSAGTYAVIMSKEESRQKVKEVVIRLQSGEQRKIDPDACCTVGVASNPHAHFAQLGKAGRARWLGIRPTVRGLAMNAADHPHGGGRGKSKGNVHPVSPWGTPAKGGYKTRRKRNKNVWLVQDRVRNQGKRRPK